MISRYDYFIIAFYFVFILAIGVAFRRLSRNTSDYFRCGGAMPWWITGTSAWIAGFSAWTFTGAAGRVYETGLIVLLLYYSNLLGLLIVFAYTCVRFRRMRVVTWMEAVRHRFGGASEQFYTWVKVPLVLFFGGVGLNAIGVFMSAVFNAPMIPTLIVLGVVVTLVAFAGGAWAVLASDFVQMFLLVTITILVALLTLRQPQIQGISGLISKVPSAHFHWSELARTPIIALWAMAMLWFGFQAGNNLENATMYLMPRSDRDARRMVLIPIIGSAIGPLIWFIPSMAATITHPNLAAEFKTLPQPHEAAFVAVCMDVLPKGLLGLMLCAMLGATLTSMDAGLNKCVGVFVRSFYLPIVNPKCSEKRLLIIGKICTLIFGLLIIGIAVLVAIFRTMNLFDLTNQLAASLTIPLALPLVWGIFIKRTPGWSAWSTAILATAAAWVLKATIKPQYFQHLMGWAQPLNPREVTDFQLVVTTLGTVLIGSTWFFVTALFYSRASESERSRIEGFFANFDRPINAVREGIENHDEILYRLLGLLCLVYGGFILLLMLIPNSVGGRLCFLFCGGVIAGMGAILYWRSRVKPLNPVDLAAQPVGIA